MPDPNREAGQILEVQRRPLAEAAVARQYERQPGLRKRYGPSGQAKCVQDTEHHVAYLAASVRYSSLVLFCDYIAWAKFVLIAHGVDLEDVEVNLACLREVLAEQLPEEPSEIVGPYLQAALQSLPQAPTTLPSFLEGDDDLTILARKYLQALLRSEGTEASRLIIDAVKSGVAVADLYLQVFQRCQREIGRLWQLKQISVAQEHYCTAATQVTLSQLYPYVFALPKKGRKLVAASVSGELHEIGLRIVTDLFESDGWDTLYLGANLPAQDTVQTIEQFRPDLLLISATITFHLRHVEELIARVRCLESVPQLKVMVGGYPFNVDPELWKRVGADGHGMDAVEALGLAARLLDKPEPSERTGGKTYPAEKFAEIGRKRDTPSTGPGAAIYGEMSRLNSELVTAQRELARKNAQLERLNRRLVEADQRKDEFLAMLAHELRNPLAPLRNAVYLLQQPSMDRPLLDSTGEMMERQVQQLGRLVDDLLDLSRIARGKMQLCKEWVDLGQAARHAADASRPRIESRRHELTVSLPETPVLLWADPARLEQILTNLLNNAARYTPEGGRIWLTATVENDKAVFRVRDTGIGIPAQMRESIFGLFAQAERAEERAGGGLGIGLSLVKSLTEMHGGTVEVHSDGPGQGSEFVVHWPLTTRETPATDEVSSKEAPAAHRGMRVLVVDDNVDSAQSLAMLLRLSGHEVGVAHDGPSALQTAESQPPEVALLDISLPGMDGYELARRLRAQPSLAGVHLIALTGWGMEEERRRSKEAGFDHHLLKPVDLTTLQELLTQAQLATSPG